MEAFKKNLYRRVGTYSSNSKQHDSIDMHINIIIIVSIFVYY